ncbi:sugar kinase [Rhizobium sp. LjRoot98]|uniref:sugar kinase n=1 Tax=unclassified Rhizobium TaxID=2613769 RepID=UPI00056D6140|nr:MULTISPECIES: sugar kinase [unclassified Rhizobium]KQV29856.1 2-dehydro-3-deoxygluconokinase [Rhizobium sp. Root1204]KQY05013.1 2-dehydro-3-deoxygluconokinase [Rhizobium sp. Root1334]KRC02116.1 2-dehydro-3-deoxygluconokinase [Rhizobium sp. Root73]
MTGRLLSIGECMVELMQAEGDLLRKGYAGDTFNTAYYARLFLPHDWSVDYLTAVGTDTVSDEMLAFIEKTGVGTSAIRRVEGRSPGLYMIHLKDGERSFSYWRSVSAAKTLADDATHLRAAIEASDIIVFSGITLAILAPSAVETLLSELRRAKAAGKLVIFDPNIRPRLWDDKTYMRETVSAGARASSLVMPSFDDEQAHFGDADIAATIARYRGLGVDNIVVKDGPKGVTLSFGDTPLQFVPSANVEKIVDTTSAGDSFNGAFLARYAVDGDASVAARFAAEAAATVIQHHGALVSRDKFEASL